MSYSLRRLVWLYLPLTLCGLVLNAVSMTLTTTLNGLTLLSLTFIVIGVTLTAREFDTQPTKDTD